MARLVIIFTSSVLALIGFAGCSIGENPEKAARKTVELYLEFAELHEHDSKWIDEHAALLDHPHYDWLGGKPDYKEISELAGRMLPVYGGGP